MQVGDRFPDAAVGDGKGHGTQVSALLAGHAAVIYFYPKDSTSGCTLEARDFQSHLAEFQKAGVAVYGVSADDDASHDKFASECGLQFPLLVDTGGALGSQLGIFDAGRGRHSRVTYLVGADGRLRQIWPAVQVKGHAAEVLAAATAPAR